MLQNSLLSLALLLVTFGVQAVERPQSPEQYLMDNGLWPQGVSNAVAYQAKHEFPFFDSRVDTCDEVGVPGTDAWPYDPQLLAAGMSGCYNLVPIGWSEPTDTVDCSGNSDVHPNHPNIYIIRSADWASGYSNADNAQYRWVLQCPGFSVTSTINVNADGVGIDDGEMRIYDCLNSDGTYEPMKPGVLRTGTGDECHIEDVETHAKYIWFRSMYYEASSNKINGPAFRVNWPSRPDFPIDEAYSGVDNSDFYLGGQTVLDSGYANLWQAFGLYGSTGWIQNSRIVDCVAERGDDGDAIQSIGNAGSYLRAINLEIVNCSRVYTGSSDAPAAHVARGNAVENLWMSRDGARFFGDTNADASPYASVADYFYWSSNYSSGTKLPYGRVAGEPPSYVKAAAASDAEVDDAFNCDNPKTGNGCPWSCSETNHVGYKQGSRPGAPEHLARRVFAYGARANRIDDDNPICTQRGGCTGNRYPSCGGSSGTDSGNEAVGGQGRIWGVRHDLMLSEGKMNAAYGGVTGQTWVRESFGVTLINSLVYHTFDAYSDNVYTDDWNATFLEETIDNNTVGDEPSYFTGWGNTHVLGAGYIGDATRPNRYWHNVGTGTYTQDCSVWVDAENANPNDNNVDYSYVGLFGASTPPTSATNRYPPTGTYLTSQLHGFCHIERPWTAIANGAEPSVKCWPTAVPATGSPIEGLCGVASP